MPLSVADARREGWVQAASGNTTSTWCLRDDPRVCVLYDLQGSVAGMQVSLPVADLQFKGNPYDVTAHPLFIRDRLFNMDVFTSRYFLYGVESHVKLREKTANFQKKLVLQGPGNEKVETLAAGGRRRAPGDEVGTGLWLQSGDDFVEVSRNADDLPAAHWSRENCVLEMVARKLPFLFLIVKIIIYSPKQHEIMFIESLKLTRSRDKRSKQSSKNVSPRLHFFARVLNPALFVLSQGRHYYYNVSEQLPCEMAEPFFLLVDNRKDALHGVGFQIFGEASVKNRKWFESVPPYAVKSTLPNSPQCLTDWVKQYGLISLHMYFVDKPWFIIC
ncbi:Uncharacterized protein GBIM_15428 [Gryllus bimaculatus]|nr:Uncharacterized protein GBIM_15428 [Gryllus bimaculatus]